MKFAIYKYELVKTNTKELFQENKSVYDNAQVYFGNLFNANQLNLSSNPQLSSSASFLRLNVLSSLN